MSSNSAPAAPNYSPIINQFSGMASQEQGLAQQQEQWAQNQYAQDQATNAGAISTDQNVMGRETGFGNDIQSQYENTYMPLEDKFAQEAENYGSTANQEYQEGRAGATAAQNADAARANTEQTLQGYGVKPSDGRLAGTDAALQAQRAASVTGAENTAGEATRETALGLESTAIGQGQQGEALGQGAVNAGVAAGSQGVTNRLATTASGASTMGTGMGFYGGATGALSGATSAMNSQYQNQLAQFQANQQAASGWGGLVGGIVGAGIGIGGWSKNSVGGGWLGFDKGGAVPANDDVQGDDGTQGGFLEAGRSPSGGAVTDDIPAQSGHQAIRLNAGEFVMPREVVGYYGARHFKKMIDQAHKDMGVTPRSKPQAVAA